MWALEAFVFVLLTTVESETSLRKVLVLLAPCGGIYLMLEEECSFIERGSNR